MSNAFCSIWFLFEKSNWDSNVFFRLTYIKNKEWVCNNKFCQYHANQMSNKTKWVSNFGKKWLFLICSVQSNKPFSLKAKSDCVSRTCFSMTTPFPVLPHPSVCQTWAGPFLIRTFADSAGKIRLEFDSPHPIQEKGRWTTISSNEALWIINK